MRTQGCYVLSQVLSVHSRHKDIRQEEVDRALMLLADWKGIDPSACLQDRVAVHLEDLTNELPHWCFIIDEKNSLRKQLRH
jgi:hypothetical protein